MAYPRPIRDFLRALGARLSVAAGAALLCSAAYAQGLTVALYPYVPRLQQFQDAITKNWNAVQPGVPLTFLPVSDWDGGYTMDPPPNADVFVFDAMYLALFQSQNNLVPFAPTQIDDLSDFLPYAINGAASGGDYLAIPMFGCTNILFYQTSDTALDDAVTVSDVTSALNQCTYTSLIPPDRRGIMLDMSGGTTNVTLYADIEHSITGAYPLPQPPATQLDPNSIAVMKQLLATASFYNAADNTSDAYQRSAWYSQGYGRAVVGFSESMSEMSPATLANTSFKIMPLSDNPDTPPLFYADMIGVNSTTTTRGTTAQARQLANQIASTSTFVDSVSATPTATSPQYLLPTRVSTFAALAATYPVYGELQTMTLNASPVLFALDASARSWVSSVKSTVVSQSRANYQCGCDFPAGQPIMDNAAAPAICTPVCAQNGGWNGNWTNQPPVTGSVCQCNTCPIPSVAAKPAGPTLARPSKP